MFFITAGKWDIPSMKGRPWRAPTSLGARSATAVLPMGMQMTNVMTRSEQACFGGTIGFYSHASTEIGAEMKFSVFVPPNGPARPRPARAAGSGSAPRSTTRTRRRPGRRAPARRGRPHRTRCRRAPARRPRGRTGPRRAPRPRRARRLRRRSAGHPSPAPGSVRLRPAAGPARPGRSGRRSSRRASGRGPRTPASPAGRARSPRRTRCGA